MSKHEDEITQARRALHARYRAAYPLRDPAEEGCTCGPAQGYRCTLTTTCCNSRLEHWGRQYARWERESGLAALEEQGRRIALLAAVEPLVPLTGTWLDEAREELWALSTARAIETLRTLAALEMEARG